MPLIDRRTDSVVLRIVYDGPPEAGKTTNLRQLCERLSLGRRGALESPGGGDRTQFFDWLDVTGGYIAGRRLRCQLVTVPGQTELARRRRYLLDTADVVVFVADARVESLTETRASLASLRRAIAARGTIPLLVQANKQDVAGALDLAALVAALELDDGVPVVAASACNGIGVLETFMLGVRLAVDQIRPMLARGQLGEGEAGGWGELLSTLQSADVAAEAEAALEGLATAATALVMAAGAPVETAVEMTRSIVTVETGSEPAPAAPVELPRLVLPSAAGADAAMSRSAEGIDALAEALPRGDAETGLVWPPQSGRFVLRTLDDARAHGALVTTHASGALRCGDWRLYASPSGLGNRDEARRHLLAAVSRQPALGALVPASRTIALGVGSNDRHRLWYLVEAPRTLADAIDDGLADFDERCAAALELVDRLCAIAERVGLTLQLDDDRIAEDGDQYLGPAWPGRPPSREDARRELVESMGRRRRSKRATAPLVPAAAEPPAAPVVAAAPAASVAPSVAMVDEVDEVDEVDALPMDDEEMVSIDGALDDTNADDDDALSATVATEPPTLVVATTLPEHPAATGDEESWELPSIELPAGMVWPLVRGRAALAAIATSGLRTGRPLLAWVPSDAIEVGCGDGWLAHTASTWQFPDLDEGRRGLLEAVRWQTRLGDLTPDGRTLAVCPAADGARLWMISADVASCWSRIRAAAAAGLLVELHAAIATALSALDHVRAALARSGQDVELDLDVIAVDGRPRLLAAPPTRAVSAPRAQLAVQLDEIARLTGERT